MSTILLSLKDALMNRLEYAKERIPREKVLLYFSLTLIVLIAFVSRIMPAFRYEPILKGNDPFIQLTAVKIIIEEGFGAFLTWWDKTAWYPTGYPRGARLYIGTPFGAVFIYYLMNLLGFPISMEVAAYYEPAVFGTLSVIAIYFLGKEIGNEKVGLLAAFFLSFSPGHLQRSTVGFFDNEAIGIFFLILTLYFFARSLNRDSLMDAFIAGLCLGGIANSWSGFIYTLDLLALYVLIMILFQKYSDRLLKSYGLTYTVFLLIALLTPRNLYAKTLFSVSVLGPGVVLLVLVLFELYDVYGQYLSQEQKNLLYRGVIISSALIIVLGTVAIIIRPSLANIASKFITTVLPFFRDQTPILKSVAEHQTVAWATMYEDVGGLLLFIPIGIYYTYKRPTEMNLFATIYMLTALYFVGSMVRLVLIFAPAIALYSAKVIVDTLVPYIMIFQQNFSSYQVRRRQFSVSLGPEQVLMAFGIIAVVLFSVTFSSMQFVERNAATPQSILTPTVKGQRVAIGNDWQEAIKWIKEHMSETKDVGLFWWDYGYWIHVNANATVLVDNATGNQTQIGNVGAALMSTPDISLKIMKRYHVTYVVVVVAQGRTFQGFDSDLGKVPWMIRIANKSGDLVTLNVHDYLELDPSGKRVISYINKFYKSTFWGLLTEGVSATIFGAITQYGPVDKNAQQGFAPEYRPYANAFEEAYFTSNQMIRIFRVNYDKAPPSMTWDLGDAAQ